MAGRSHRAPHAEVGPALLTHACFCGAEGGQGAAAGGPVVWERGWWGRRPGAPREEARGRARRRRGYVAAVAGSREAGRHCAEGTAGDGTSEERGRPRSPGQLADTGVSAGARQWRGDVSCVPVLACPMSALRHGACAWGDCRQPAHRRARVLELGLTEAEGFSRLRKQQTTLALCLRFPLSCKWGDFHQLGWREQGNYTD